MPECVSCNANVRRLNQNNQCHACAQNDTSMEASEASARIPAESNSDDFWQNMNKLFDNKFQQFETSFKTTMMTEVKKITNPMEADIKNLKEENKKLKAEITLLKSKDKEHCKRLDTVESTLKEHQKYLARSDKDARSKRLVLSGVPEGNTTINGVETNDDKKKVQEILKVVDAENVGVHVKRIGKKDQGIDERPRYILMEFSNTNDRHSVKRKSEKLKDNENTKNFYMKADSTKKERAEYKRLFQVKKRLEEEDPSKVVRIEYGKLLVDDVVVDEIVTASSDFLG